MVPGPFTDCLTHEIDQLVNFHRHCRKEKIKNRAELIRIGCHEVAKFGKVYNGTGSNITDFAQLYFHSLPTDRRKLCRSFDFRVHFAAVSLKARRLVNLP